MNKEHAVEVAAALAGGGTSRGIMTPIDSKERPTFLPRRVRALPKGDEILVLVQEIRRNLKTHEPKVFTWLNASPGNAEKYASDPLGSLTKIGVELDQDTRGKLSRLGKLLQAGSPASSKKEG